MLRYYRLPQVEELTGLSGTTIWRREKAGEFPRRRQLGAGSVGWRSDELEEWLESREPVELGGTNGAGSAG